MRLSRDVLIVLLLFLALVGLTTFLGVRQAEAEQAQQNSLPYSSYSAQSAGTLGLYDWLDALGYRVGRIEGDTFAVDPSARVLLILSTVQDFTPGEASAVRQWVEQGNTLIACDSLLRGRHLWDAFKVAFGSISTVNGELALSQPILGDPSVRVSVNPRSSLKLARNDYVTYLGDQGEPFLVSFQQGKGRVWLCSVPELFSNDNLTHDGNAAVIGAMLTGAPRGSTVLFDELHLDVARPTPSLQSVIYRTPWGWALILACLVLFGYLVLNGQRLGRVRQLPRELARRNPAEYVISMAQLFRRADKRALAARHYHQQLKRRLGRPYALSPDMPDAEFVEALERQRENLDSAALLETLRGLDQKRVDDRTLVKLAAQAASFEAVRKDGGP